MPVHGCRSHKDQTLLWLCKVICCDATITRCFIYQCNHMYCLFSIFLFFLYVFLSLYFPLCSSSASPPYHWCIACPGWNFHSSPTRGRSHTDHQSLTLGSSPDSSPPACPCSGSERPPCGPRSPPRNPPPPPSPPEGTQTHLREGRRREGGGAHNTPCTTLIYKQ